MSSVQAIKQLEERNVASEIVLMVWSDRMDLVALANVKGEVSLHRLAWTKAWTLAPPKEGIGVKAITWRPDGKIIAIAYSSKHIVLVRVENKGVVFSFEISSEVSCMYWTQDMSGVKGGVEESNQCEYMKTVDASLNFLPEPSGQSFDSGEEEQQNSNLLQQQTHLNLLLVGSTEGEIHVRIFGSFACVKLNLEGSPLVQSIHLNERLTRIFVTTKDSGGVIKLLSFNSEIFNTHVNELFALALKHIKIVSVLNYLASTITTITESWESLLLEMDNKLSKYASKVPEGGVTADFLDLLTFGICSNAMKDFLIHDLTKKGLEKFGQTIEMSYSNIHKLMLKYVLKYGQNVTYHLAELRGMARLEHRYKILGLTEESISEAILSNGAFMIKGGEMQQIINQSAINYKAFFRWLYTAIMHVLDEPIPNEIPKMTQQDLAYITDFLQNFDGIKSGFIMERLGQYLGDGPLTIEPDMTGNDWTTFLSENQCIQKHPFILKHFTKMSLIQQYKHLKAAVDDIFAQPIATICRHFNPLHTIDCFHSTSDSLRTSQINVSHDTILFAFLQPAHQIHALQIKQNRIVVANLYFEEEEGAANYNIVDVQLYSSTVLSCLLQDSSRTTILYQVPLGGALDKFVEVGSSGTIFSADSVVNLNCANLTPKLLKIVDGMVGSQFAVSGARRVGIVLAENRRKVRLYEMEGEEDEEDADMTNCTLKDAEMSLT